MTTDRTALLYNAAKHLMIRAKEQARVLGSVPRVLLVFGPDGALRVTQSLSPLTDVERDAVKRDAVKRAGNYAYVAEVLEGVRGPLTVSEQVIVIGVQDTAGCRVIYAQPFIKRAGHIEFGEPYVANDHTFIESDGYETVLSVRATADH